MIYPDVTVEEWCKRYPTLQLALPAVCSRCGQAVQQLRPYIAKNTLGLSSFPCSCGEERPFSAAMFRPGPLKDELIHALEIL